MSSGKTVPFVMKSECTDCTVLTKTYVITSFRNYVMEIKSNTRTVKIKALKD